MDLNFPGMFELIKLAPGAAAMVFVAVIWYRNEKEKRDTDRNRPPQKPPTSIMSTRCPDHSKLESSIAVILEKLNKIHEWMKDKDSDTDRKFDEIFNRLRKAETKITVLEATRDMHLVTDDTKEIG